MPFSRPRLMLAPAGVHLPRGMRPVTAIASSGSRGGRAVAAVAGDGGAYVAALPGDHRCYGFPGAGGRAFSGAASFGLMVSSAAATGGGARGGVAVAARSDGGGSGRFLALVAKAAGQTWATTDDGEFDRPKSEVLLAWKDFEVRAQPLAFLGTDQLCEVELVASKGIKLVTEVLMAKAYCSQNDLTIIEAAGRTLRLAVLQAKHGYVPATSVVVAANALKFMYDMVIAVPKSARRVTPLPPKVSVAVQEVPAKIEDVDAYFRDLVEGLGDLIDTVEKDFVSAQDSWNK